MKLTVFPWIAISSLALTVAVPVRARTRPHYGGTLRAETSTVVANNADFLRPLVGDTLTSLDEQGAPIPRLALRWESQNGGKRWQFWVRGDAKLPDGTFLTASLVAQSLQAMTSQFHRWQSIRADGNTVIFESNTPMPDLPAELASPLDSIAFADPSGIPIGSGAFRVEGGSPDSVILKANPDYWAGRPFVDSLVITTQQSVRAQWLDLNVARADIAEVPAERIPSAQQARLRTAVSSPDELLALQVSDRTPQLQDVHLRQAIEESIDRTSILNFIYQKQGEVTGSLLPAWMTGYGMLFPSSQNLDAARNLRAGLAYVPSLTVVYPSGDQTLQLVAERIALNIRDAGLNAQALPDTPAAKADIRLVRLRLESADAAVALAGIAQALGLELPPSTSHGIERIYGAEQAMLATYRVVPLLYLPTAYAAGTRVRNWKVSNTGTLSLASYWVEDHR